jgi:branched-chain amino acid transport system permease protein
MKPIALAAALLLLALAPLLIDNSYYLNIVSQVLISAIFAQGLNLLVGYAGLVSLGHAGLFGVGAYAGAFLLAGGSSQIAAAAVAIGATLATSAVFAFLALRATGIGFFMITVALGQIAWGIAYRWISLTGGDNGISVAARPAPFGISLAGATPFFYATLIVFLGVQGAVMVFVRSPLGISLRGTRDQPRRMTALGFNVWLIRFIAFVLSGLVSGIAGLLSLYLTKFVSPHVLALGQSAEALLMVISGGTGTLLGPVVGAALVVAMKYIVSAYVERWNLVLGAIFVAIVLFMPEGLVPGSVRLARKLGRRNIRGRKLRADGAEREAAR